MSYDGYLEYPQLHGRFEHAVTALDLLFNTGPEVSRYLSHPAQTTSNPDDASSGNL
jgi:hypothetical protein